MDTGLHQYDALCAARHSVCRTTLEYCTISPSSPRRRPGSIGCLLQGTSDFLDLKDLELIAFFDVIKVLQRQTALEA
jgi:hypothetical protein